MRLGSVMSAALFDIVPSVIRTSGLVPACVAERRGQTTVRVSWGSKRRTRFGREDVNRICP
jgi:hypothetical protein